ncbi:MAG: class I SAM-dependent methyltransferase [Flavobacteriaceae bacterium]
MNIIRFFLVVCILSISRLNGQYTKEDWPDRDQWMKTETLLTLSGIQIGYKVADIGCHEGYLSMHLAKKVSMDGRVYAVDVRSDRLETLRITANERGHKSVITILGDYDDPKLPKSELDIVFIIDTYHEIEAYEKVLRLVKSGLKPNGKIMILEKLKKRVKGKSREEQVAAHSLSMGYVKKELKQAGFTITSEIANHGKWEREEDKQMWVVLAQKLE